MVSIPKSLETIIPKLSNNRLHVSDVRSINDWQIDKEIALKKPDIITSGGGGEHFHSSIIMEPDKNGKLSYTLPISTPNCIRGQMKNDIHIAQRLSIQRTRMLKKLQQRRIEAEIKSLVSETDSRK